MTKDLRMDLPLEPPSSPAPAEPSATIVLLRDTTRGMEVLLLRRGRQLAAFGGVWVFPGGAMDPDDRTGEDGASFQEAARYTAVRELAEETGLVIDPQILIPLSHWTAPVNMPRRFDTWFFLATAPAGEVSIDQSEIHDHRWLSPRAALAAHQAGQMAFLPPTWVTLRNLMDYNGCQAALAAAREGFPCHFAPRVVPQGPDLCFLYTEDAAYEDQRIDTGGMRHRLWVRAQGWQYERSPGVTSSIQHG